MKPVNPFALIGSVPTNSQRTGQERVRFAVFSLLGIQTALLLVLLLLGDQSEIEARGRSLDSSSDLSPAQHHQRCGAEHSPSAITGVSPTVAVRSSPSQPMPVASPQDIPLASPEMAGSLIIHSVKSGDTLSQIARLYGTSIRTIKTANHLKTERLAVGNKLVIPSTKLLAVRASKPDNPQ